MFLFSLVRRMRRDLLWVTSMERCCKVCYIFNLSRVVTVSRADSSSPISLSASALVGSTAPNPAGVPGCSD